MRVECVWKFVSLWNKISEHVSGSEIFLLTLYSSNAQSSITSDVVQSLYLLLEFVKVSKPQHK